MTANDAISQQMDCPLMVCRECGEAIITYNGRQFWTCEHQGGEAILTMAGIGALAHVA